MRKAALLLVTCLLFALNANTISIAGFQEDSEACTKPPPGDYDGPIEACTRQIESGRWKGKDLSIMLRNQGLAYFARFKHGLNRSDFDAAIASFTKAYENQPAYLDALKSRAWAYDALGDYANEIKDCSEVLRRQPGDADALFARGRTYSVQHKYNEAIKDFQDLLELQPQNQFAHIWSGEAFSALGKDELALRHFDAALRIAPTNAAALADRAHIYQRRGLIDKAMEDLDKSISNAPDGFYQTYETRGDLFSQKGDYSRAIEDYTRAVGRAGLWKRFPLLKRGDAYLASGDMDRALADYDGANKDFFGGDAKFLRAIVKRGLVKERKGDVASALDDYKEALTIAAKDDADRQALAAARDRIARLENGAAPTDTKKSEPTNHAGEEQQPVPELGRRVALVIGNGAYVNANALANPVNDARAMSKALTEIGFEVSDGYDLDHRAMERLVRDFLAKAEGAKVALLYYAGHGMQVDAKNYLIPVDATLSAAADLSFETISLDTILGNLDDQKRANIVILDACRDNPLARHFASRLGTTRSASVAAGLAAYAAVGTGTLIAYSTAPGQVALDGDGANSPFTAALVRHIAEPGIEVRQMLTQVRADVAAATGFKQVPWDNSSLLGAVYLVRK